MDYNIFADGRLVGSMYREGGTWWVDDRSSTEEVGSIREATMVLERRGYTVQATAFGGLTVSGQ